MIELLSIVGPNGSLLHLGAALDEDRLPPETRVPKDVPLAFWHDDSPLFDLENPHPISGRLCPVWPVLIAGDSYLVLAGEVEDAVDGVMLSFSEPDEEPYAQRPAPVSDVLGRRVWMSHPEKMRRRTAVRVVWLHGEPESILIDPMA